MKTRHMLTIAFVALVGFANAQQSPNSQITPKEKATRTTEKMAKHLGLDETQKGKIIESKMVRIQKMDELNQKYGATRKDHKDEYKAVMMKYREDVKSTLTPEQFAKWDEHVKQRMQQRREKINANKTNPKAPASDELDLEEFMIED